MIAADCGGLPETETGGVPVPPPSDKSVVQLSKTLPDTVVITGFSKKGVPPKAQCRSTRHLACECVLAHMPRSALATVSPDLYNILYRQLN